MASRALLRAAAAPAVAQQARTARTRAAEGKSKVRQLRLWKRSQVRLAATLTGPGGSDAVTVQDISRHGAGLAGIVLCERGQAVSLAFGNGRILAARVRWRIGMRAGLAFDAPLREGDPLLEGSHAGAPLAASSPPATGMSMRMLTRACREQGFAWLTDFDDE